MQNLYQIGMHIALQGNALAALGQIAFALGGVHRQIHGITQAFKGWHGVLVGGAMGIGAGLGVVDLMAKMVLHAKDLTHELSNLEIMNFSKADRDAIYRSAVKTADTVRGTTISGNLSLANQVALQIGPAEAAKALPALAQLERALGGIYKDPGRAHDQVSLAIRGGDLLGKIVDPNTHKVDPDRLLHFTDLLAQMAAGTHGRVGPREMMQAIQTGGPAMASLDDEGLLTMGMIAQGMGGFRSGTGATALAREFQGGIMTERVATELKKLGLVGNFTTNHGKLVWDEGALDTPFAKSLQKDPMQAAKMLEEHLDAAGFTSMDSKTKELFRILGTETSRRVMNDLLRNLPQMVAERGRIENIPGAEGQNKIRNEKDMYVAADNLTAAWNKMWESIAGPSSEHYIAVMKQVEDLFTAIGKWAREHPTAMKVIIEGVAGLGAVIAGLGVAAVITACVALAPAGAVYVAAGALVTIIGSIAAANWESVKQLFQSILDWVGKMIDKAKEWFHDYGGNDSGAQPRPNGNYTPFRNPFAKTAYHPGGGANDNYSWSDIGQGYTGGVAGSAKGAALIARLVKEDGLTPEQAAGIVGNLGHESGGFRHFKELGGGGLGWAQWTGVRARAFLSWSKRHGLDPHSDEANWGFLHADPEWKRAIGAVRGTHSTADAMLAFEHSYERAGIKAYGSRLGHGRAALGAYSARSKKAIEEGVTPPPRRSNDIHVHNTTMLDGEVVARNTTRKQSKMAMFPTSSGDIDPHGRYHDAGTRFADVG